MLPIIVMRAAACPNCGSDNTRDSPYNDGFEECMEPDCGADWRKSPKRGIQR